MKVNLGAGPMLLPGWVNVDAFNGDAEVREDIRTVSFPAGSVDEVLTSHVLEHLPRSDAVALVAKIFHWLKPGGLFVCEMPDLDRCLELGTSKHFIKACCGLKGITGGRQTDKDQWRLWMIQNREAILAAGKKEHTADGLVPVEWKTPGDSHLYVWRGEEFAAVCRSAGFSAILSAGQIHGVRYQRDFRCEARKCE